MNSKAKAWLVNAHHDLEAMRAMLPNEELTAMVAFHAQQCVEKAFKAILERHTGKIPRIHDLVRLYEMIAVYDIGAVDKDILGELSDLYIDTRYPADFGLLATGLPDIDDAKRFLKFADEVYCQIETCLTAP